MNYNRSLTATVYVVSGEQVLLHWHKKYQTWFPPGGHLLPDEFPHQAALREVREETGLQIELLETETAPPIELGSVERVPAPFCILYEGIGSSEEFMDFNFIGFAEETKLQPQENESKRCRWFSQEELLREAVKPHIKNTALAVLDYIKTR